MKLKRILAIALCICMVFSTMNFIVFAEDHSDVIASVTSEVINDDLTLNVKFSGDTAVESYKKDWWMNVFFTANKDLTFGDSGADGYFVVSNPMFDLLNGGLPVSCPKSGATIEYKAGEKIKLLDQYWVAINYGGKTQKYEDIFTPTWNNLTAGIKLLKEDPELYGEISLEIYQIDKNIEKNHIVLASESFGNKPVYVAKIGNTSYQTVEAAIAAASDGDVVTVISDISDLALTIDKSIELTGNVNANNVSVTGSGADTELKVSNISFTGNSWINSNGVKSLEVSGVNANVTPSNTSATNSRSAFISLGRSEGVELKLTVENSKIVSLGGSDPILGWAKITEATLTGNTFGSASNHQTYSDSVKFMSIADGAVFNITGNTVYSDYNGIVFAQNTTRDNKYTANISGNTFVGGADHIWIEITGGNTVHATINASSTNTVNGNTFTTADIKAHTDVIKNWSSYAGVDVVTDANGKVIGGKFAFINEDVIADDYILDESGSVVKEGVSFSGEGTEEAPYLIKSGEELAMFRNSVNAGENYKNVYFKLENDIDLAASSVSLLTTDVTPNWEPIGTSENPFKGTFDGNGKIISNLIVKGEANQGFIGYADSAVIKNIKIENAIVIGTDCVSAVAGQVYSVSRIENCHVSGNIQITGQTNVGGITGKYYTKVSDSSVIGDGANTSFVKGVYVASDLEGDNIGGIMGHCGENNALTGNVVKNITVSGTRKVGGIVGIADQNTDVTGCTVENVVIETTATAEYAASKKTSMSIGGLIGQYQAAGSSVDGSVADSKVSNVTFEIPDGVVCEAGAIAGGARGGSNGMLPPSDKITVSSNTVESVTGATNSYMIPAVAKVGDKTYADIQEAIKAASSGDVVTVISDIVAAEPINIEEGKELTLDLNGYVIKGGWNGTSTTNHIYALNNYGTLTIKDSSENGEGAIISRGMYNYGKLTLESGTIDACDGNGGYAVNNVSGSTFIMNGGKIIASYEDDNQSSSGGYDATALKIPANSTTTLNGGEIVDVCDFTYAVDVSGGALEVPETSTVVVKGAHGAVSISSGVANIAGGTFKCEGLETKNTDNVIYTSGSGVANISGGTFAGDKDNANGGACICDKSGKVTVTGGTFGNSSGGDVWGTTGTVIKGGTFENLTEKQHIADGYKIDDNGNVVKSIDGLVISNLNDLVKFRDAVNAGDTYSGKTVTLAADIDLSGINWTPIGSAYKEHGFMGNFDGNGYKISNLTITNPPVDSDGYVYAGLFGVTEGTDKNNQNFIKNLTIENVTISTTGQIVAAAIAYPYYTIVENVNVCGDIAIKGGNYTAGILAYTRRCVNASNLTIKGNEGSYIEGAQVVGGVISDIQMNGGLIAQYSDFSAEGLTIKGNKNVGGISGIIATQTLNTCSVKNVTIECEDAARKGIVSGCFGGVSTISDITAENVTGAKAVIGGSYDNGAAIEAKIGDTYYATLQAAVDAVKEGETITLLDDVTVTTAAYGTNAINYAKAVNSTIDLNGKTLTSDVGNSVFRFNITGTGATEDITVTIKNGTVVSGANTWCTLMAAGISENAKAVLNLENVDVYASKAGDLAIKAWQYGLVNAKNVNVYATNGAGGFYALGGEIVLDNCTVDQKGLHTAPYLSMALAVSTNGKLTVNSGNYSSAPTAAAEGNNQGSSHGSWVAGVMNSGGTLVINGGTFANGNYGDDSLATAARGLLFVDTGAVLEINGGTFNALKSIVDYQNNLGDAAKNPQVTIKGGTYSANPESTYVKIPDGYVVNKNADEQYEVVAKAKEELAAKGAWVKDMKFNIDGTDYYQVILLSGIDSLDYDEVGFEVTVDGVTQIFKTDKVFRRIKIVDKDGNAQPVYASNFGKGVNYIFGESFNFTLDFKDKSITFVPFAIREGETEPIYGRANVIEKIYE